MINKFFILLLLSFKAYSSVSDRSCEKSLSDSIFINIGNQAKKTAQRAIYPIVSAKRAIVRKRLLTKHGEIKQPYKGTIGQALYADSYHKRWSMGGPNVNAAYKSVKQYLTPAEMRELQWNPPVLLNP
ncbi:MAG: hypothetical protein OXK80_00070 [Bdellovibrionales bacterium]|nr:hypothetical protein [Bdellovibrionales bacterium]